MENDDPEVIRQRMDETRSSLSEKLEALESKVTQPVNATVDAVTDTVEQVKESVDAVTDSVKEAVESVKETFNLRRQVERNPWLMLGGAVAVGFAGSRLIRSPGRAVANLATAAGSAASDVASSAASAASNAASAAVASATPSWLSSTPAGPPATSEGPSLVQETMGTLRGLAVGALMGLLRDMAAESLPSEIGRTVADSVDELTTRLGGTRIAEVLPRDDEQPHEEPALVAPEGPSADSTPTYGADRPTNARNRRTARAGRK